MKKGLDVKDLINVGLFTVLIFLFTFAGGMIGLVPVMMPFVPFICGLLAGPVYMLFAAKIKKPGMLFIQQMLIALVFIATGHGPWGLLTAPIGALLGEWMLKKGDYASIKHARRAFVLSTLSGLGNFLPIFFTREAYVKHLLDSGYGQEYADKMMRAMPNWSLAPIVLLGLIGVYIGCTIGIAILRKHFVKAGMVEGV